MVINKLRCVGRDGTLHNFVYECDKGTGVLGDEWTYRVRTESSDPEDQFFELRLVETLPGVARVDMVNNFGDARFTAKGIPDALLPVVKSKLGMQIVSSPRLGPGGIYRTDAATKMWERLIGKGLAAYDSTTDVFSLR